MKKIDLSVVGPAYNEQEVIPEFHRRLLAVLEPMNIDFEILYVNDGSKDKTWEILQELRAKDPRVTLVNLSRNFGKEIALTAGLDLARGDTVAAIDTDLQDPPELIPELYAGWKEGFDVVYAKRIDRAGESAFKKFTSFLFYRMLSGSTNIKVPLDTGDYRLMSRRSIEALKQLKEKHRYMKGLFSWIGYPQKAVPFHRDRRFAGKTKWNYFKLINLAIEGFTSFTIAPLKFATIIGTLTSFLAFAYGVYLFIDTLVNGNKVPGYPSLMLVILFLGGVQLIAIGIIGEYLGRVFNETKHRPLYLVMDYLVTDSSKTKDKKK